MFLNLVTAVFFIWLGLKLIRGHRTNRGTEAAAQAKKSWEEATARVLSLETQFKENLETAKALRESELRLAFEAMNREKRAVDALVAVLQNQGCTPEQIQEVMEKL